MVETELTPSILAGVFAILGVGIGATLQRNLEHRRWLRDARYVLYSEFSEIARHAAEANMELKKEVAALPPNTLLDDDRAQALVSNLQDHQKQLERLYYRILMVGSINMQHMADRITASAEEVAYLYIIGRLPITQENFHEHLLLRHETVDDFIHAARNDLRSVDRVDAARASMYLRVKRLHHRFRLRRMRRHTTYSNEGGT
jgi:hypothetical protein